MASLLLDGWLELVMDIGKNDRKSFVGFPEILCVFYVHCAVRVIDEDGDYDVTIELIPGGGSKKVYWWSNPNDPHVKKYDSDSWVQVAVPEGMDVREFDQAVLHSAYLQTSKQTGQRYSSYGESNSNRFIYDVIRGAGGEVPRSPSDNFWFGAPGLCGGLTYTVGSYCSD